MKAKETIHEFPEIRKRLKTIKKHLTKHGIKQQKVVEIVGMKKQNVSKLLLNQWTPKNIDAILTKIEKHYSLN